MAITVLPYPSMDFTPLDVLTADELDQIVANIDAINNASIPTSSIANSAITTAKINDGAITTNKIDANAITQAKVDLADLTTMTAISFTDYFTPTAGWTFTGQFYKLGHFVFGSLESTHAVSINQNNIGTCSSDVVQFTYGAGRVGDSQNQNSYAGTVLFLPNGQVRFHAAHAGTSLAFTILLYVSN